MKNSEEIAKTVFQARDKYLESQRTRNRRIKKAAGISSIACIFLLTIIGVGYWNDVQHRLPSIQTEISTEETVDDVYVMYTSDTQDELDEAKAYCEANGFDMSIMRFYLYDESKIVPELGNESAGESAGENAPLAGDISADNTLGILDAVYLQKYLLNAAVLSEAQYARADVDQNHVVDAFDLAILKRLLIK